MSRDGGKRGKSGRTVEPDEAELWGLLTRSVNKVKAKPRVTSHAVEASGPQRPADVPTPPAKAASPARKPVLPVQPAPARRAPPLAAPDRRTVRQVASGKTAIEARLDLHGMRQGDARARLMAFLLDAQARGCRNVLVITGKGGDAGADPLAGALGERQRGVLRRNVPQWLELPELRAVVLGYAPAGARHGGDGALYVQLRKRREA